MASRKPKPYQHAGRITDAHVDAFIRELFARGGDCDLSGELHTALRADPQLAELPADETCPIHAPGLCPGDCPIQEAWDDDQNRIVRGIMKRVKSAFCAAFREAAEEVLFGETPDRAVN